MTTLMKEYCRMKTVRLAWPQSTTYNNNSDTKREEVKTMLTRILGRSGIEISAMGLGCASITGAWTFMDGPGGQRYQSRGDPALFEGQSTPPQNGLRRSVPTSRLGPRSRKDTGGA